MKPSRHERKMLYSHALPLELQGATFAHYDATTSWYFEYMNNFLLHMMISVDKKSISVKKGFERVVNSDVIA